MWSYGPDTDFMYMYMCTVTLTLEIWPLCEILSRSNISGSEKLWPGHGFWVCVHCDLGGITLGQGRNTFLGHGQQLCEISRSDKGVRIMARWTRCEQTDEQTDRVIPIYPPKVCLGGYNKFWWVGRSLHQYPKYTLFFVRISKWPPFPPFGPKMPKVAILPENWHILRHIFL